MEKYIDKIYNTIKDYRNDDQIKLNNDHIYRWINQFDKSVQLPMIRELSYILSRSYLSRVHINRCLKNIISFEQIHGGNIIKFWKNANILNIQLNGHSQEEISLELIKILLKDFGITANISDNYSGNLIYIDDFLYSGNRLFKDIENIICDIKDNTFIDIILFGAYKYGLYKTEDRLRKLIHNHSSTVNFKIWKFIELENRQSNRDQIDAYYPTYVPNNTIINSILVDDKYPFIPRNKDCYVGNIFNNDNDRHILEQQLLLAGANIISMTTNINRSFRPLGIGGFGLGFGTTIATYRNCPNNAPLALWWGSNECNNDHPLSKWYPLFPRKTYSIPQF